MHSVLLFIESNTTTGGLFLSTAKEMGFIPVVVSTDPERYPFYPGSGVWLRIATLQPESILQALQVFVPYQLAGVISSSDHYVTMAASYAEKWGLAGPEPEAVQLCRDKYAFRQAMSGFGFRTPRYHLLRSEEDLGPAAEKLGFPMVIKPRCGTGSVSVSLVSDMGEARQQCQRILSEQICSERLRFAPGALAEEFIDGEEYSAEVFNGLVIGLTRKHLSQKPWFVELGHDFPWNLNGEEDEIRGALTTMIKAMKLGFGPLHVEFRIRDGDVYLIEINPRLAGGFIPTIVRNATGIDLIKATLAAATGREVDLRPLRSAFSAIRFLSVTELGRIERACIDSSDASVDYQLYRPLPVTVDIVHHDFRDRIGHIVVTMPTQEETTRLADDLILKTRLIHQV